MSYLITVLCLGLLQNLVLRFLLFYVRLRLLFQFYNLLTIQAERQVLKLKDRWWIRTTFIRFIASNVHLLNNFTYNHSVPTHTRICHAQQISFRCCHPPYFYLQLFVSWVSCQPDHIKLYLFILQIQWIWGGSDSWPFLYERNALPTELQILTLIYKFSTAMQINIFIL